MEEQDIEVKRHRKKKRKGIPDAVYIVMIIVFLLVALVCAAMLMLREYNRLKADRLYDRLAKNTTIENTTTGMQDETQTQPAWQFEDSARKIYEKYGVDIPKKYIDFDELHKTVSEDIYAWIYIPNTNIDYPVLQSATDNSYYLEHNLDGSEGYPGCIYTENYNSKDFTDRQTVIYGHNMRDGRMFSDLHSYESQEFFDANRYVYIYTQDNEVLVYKIFAAYQTGNSHQLFSYSYSSNEDVLRYLNNVMTFSYENQTIDRGMEFDGSENILTLSTCVMTERQFRLRYLVQAIKLNTD